MTLENVCTIGKANFWTDLKDNGTYAALPYNPSLGDKGGKVNAYTEKAKGLLSLNMVDDNYELTQSKDC